MAEKEAALGLLLALLLEDDDEVKTRGPTRKWIKRRQELQVEDDRRYKNGL